MGFLGDIARGLNVFSGPSRPKVTMPKGAMRLEEYQKALGLHEHIKGLIKERKRSKDRIKSYASVKLGKHELPQKINEILYRDQMGPQYDRLKNKWLNTSRETQHKLQELTGSGTPPWELGEHLQWRETDSQYR